MIPYLGVTTPVQLADIEFYGPILSALTAAVVALSLYIRVLHREAKADAAKHALDLKAAADEYARRLEVITAAHAAKLDEIGTHRADQAREMVDTLLSIQASRAEEQRTLNEALNALESTMTAVKDAVTSLSERTITHLIGKQPRPRRDSST